MGRKAYKKPGLKSPGKASELAETDIKQCDTEIPSRDKTIDDFIFKIDTRDFTARIKEKLKEIEEEK